MDASDDLRVTELLASRLCHDLISPVGAVNSGLELFREFGEDPHGEAMALVESQCASGGREAAVYQWPRRADEHRDLAVGARECADVDQRGHFQQAGVAQVL